MKESKLRVQADTFQGNSNQSTLAGTLYAKWALFNVAGNGAYDVIGSQYISYDLVMGGNGSFNVNWDANQTAKSRLIGLVE